MQKALLLVFGLVVLLQHTHAERIPRSRAEVRVFRAAHPCPATGRVRGPCPGFAVDHVEPLCAGGDDLARNMQWISDEDHRFKTFLDVRNCRRQRAARAVGPVPQQP